MNLSGTCPSLGSNSAWLSVHQLSISSFNMHSISLSHLMQVEPFLNLFCYFAPFITRDFYCFAHLSGLYLINFSQSSYFNIFVHPHILLISCLFHYPLSEDFYVNHANYLLYSSLGLFNQFALCGLLVLLTSHLWL